MQKTAYEMRISDWSSDVCSSDLNPGCVVFAGGPEVGELLAFGDVDDHVVVTGVLADDHAFIYFITGVDKESAAVLELVNPVGGGGSFVHGDEYSAHALGNIAAHGLDRKSTRLNSSH